MAISRSTMDTGRSGRDGIRRHAMSIGCTCDAGPRSVEVALGEEPWGLNEGALRVQFVKQALTLCKVYGVRGQPPSESAIVSTLTGRRG